MTSQPLDRFLSFRLPLNLYERLRRESARIKVGTSHLVRSFIIEGLTRRERQ